MPIDGLQLTSLMATILFAAAILHTFSVGFFNRLAAKSAEGSAKAIVFHLLGEVEVVFGIWGTVFLVGLVLFESPVAAAEYVRSRNFTEPLFVFVIMVVCSTRPVLNLASNIMDGVAKFCTLAMMACGIKVNGGRRNIVLFVVIMSIGPLLGSLITEPAAMTVCALLLRDRFFNRTTNANFKYAMIGLLFVNISIGGTLTSFAAPPVLMVAQTWNWDSMFMLTHFGWKAVLACLISAALVALLFRNRLQALAVLETKNGAASQPVPKWLTFLNIVAVALIVWSAHHVTQFSIVFLCFIALTFFTKKYQSKLNLKSGLLVGVFLAGLVVLGGPQGWWIAPLLEKFDGFILFAGAAGLTALTDNAAITYLGSLVPTLSDASKYALVAGSVTGGGLTVIANAPNPAGFGILNASFGGAGINPLKLFIGAILPTVIAAAFFWLL